MTRNTQLDRARALATQLWSGAQPTVSERALLDALFSRFVGDRTEFSDILEWSLSVDGGGLDTARFSYAFPGWLAARDQVSQTIMRWSGLLGSSASAAAQRVLRAARHPSVAQVLIGYARGAGADARVKYYLQFRADAGKASLDLARAITGLRIATESDGLPLHLLGLDVGDSGLKGAKLYFVRDQFSASETAGALDGWSQSLRNVLLIHRVTSPDDPATVTPSEVDFGLADNDLSWAQIAASPALAAFPRATEAFDGLRSQFQLRARRVSLTLRAPRKTNLYYVLDEADGSIVSNPPGGG